MCIWIEPESNGNILIIQGQLLTLVEYMLLLHRALLPTPVWYRFFLNKEYGSLFSSLTTGLYLTFKLTSIIEKVCYLPTSHRVWSLSLENQNLKDFGSVCLIALQVRSFIAALKALSRKDIHFGSYATSEQVRYSVSLIIFFHFPTFTCKNIKYYRFKMFWLLLNLQGGFNVWLCVCAKPW